MLKSEAIKLLNIGYVFFIIGFFIGLLISKNEDLSLIGYGFLIGYSFWATYWGVKIVRKPFKQTFYSEHVHIEAKNPSDFFYKTIQLKWYSWVILLIAGYFIGSLGGAIIKQIQLSKIAYF